MTLMMTAATGVQRNVGSVGAVWPPRFEPENARTKGFYPHRLGSLADIREVLSNAWNAHHRNGSTRCSVRAFVGRNLIETIRRGDGMDSSFRVEAVVPATHAVLDHDLVYFGVNEPERCRAFEFFDIPGGRQPYIPGAREQPSFMTPYEQIRCIEQRIVQRSSEKNSVDLETARVRIARAGYRMERLNQMCEFDLDVLEQLYHEAYQEYTFPITRENIARMLTDDNVFMVARDANNRIVSAMVGEGCPMEIDGTQMRLVELSDYATFIAHEGHGLITALQLESIRTLREEMGSQGTIIHAETRAPWTSVNIAARKAGMIYCGTAELHCTLEARRDTSFRSFFYGPYENLNVFYLPHT